MRALVLLLLATPVAFAAPIPKELRKPALVGTWEITGSNVGGAETPAYNGQKWKFNDDGTFSNPGYTQGTFTQGPEGLNVTFAAGQPAWRPHSACTADTLKLAFPNSNNSRGTDFDGANNNVVYSFKRVRE